MPCEHIVKLNKFIADNRIDVISMEMIKVVCRNCRIKHVCPSMPVEYFEKLK